MSTEGVAPDARTSRFRRPPGRRVAVIAGVWVALTAGALGLAGLMDQPVGAGERDAAQPSAPAEVSEAPASGEAGAGAETPPADAPAAQGDAVTLPPYAMVLGHRLADDVAGLAPMEQAEILRGRAMAGGGDAARLVELGSVMQVIGDAQSADFAFQQALERDPGNVAARVGVAVNPVVAGGDFEAAASALEELAADRPQDQLVRFNLAWVELYRGRTEAARDALMQTIELGEGTRLGQTATALLQATRSVEFQAP
ncbi:MAG: tetratricopeptide repeat protein [Thermoleophilia bacterium]